MPNPSSGSEKRGKRFFDLLSHYAQALELVDSMLINTFSFMVITFQGGGVTTCKFVRILPVFLLDLPVPTRSRNEGARP